MMLIFPLILSFLTVSNHCLNKLMPDCNLYVKCGVLLIASIPQTGCIEQCIGVPVMLSPPLTKSTNTLLCRIKHKGHYRIIYPILLYIQLISNTSPANCKVRP